MWSAYRSAGETDGRRPGAPQLEDAIRYAGLELVRRTIGAARVPAVETDAAGLNVLATAIRLIRDAG